MLTSPRVNRSSLNIICKTLTFCKFQYFSPVNGTSSLSLRSIKKSIYFDETFKFSRTFHCMKKRFVDTKNSRSLSTNKFQGVCHLKSDTFLGSTTTTTSSSRYLSSYNNSNSQMMNVQSFKQCSALLQRRCMSLSCFSTVPFQNLNLCCVENNNGKASYRSRSSSYNVKFNDALSHASVGQYRNFASSLNTFARHRTYSDVTTRTGFVESKAMEKKEEQMNNRHFLDKPSLIPERTKHVLNHRMSKIKKRLLDKNINIQEKLKFHRFNGEKAVRRLRKKIQSQKEDIRTIPNLLTTLRIVSAPALVYLVLNDHFGYALSIFVLAGFTDMLDGYIARNFKNQRTAFGTALDPLADKLLISCLTISLTSAGLIPVPLTALILSRDAGLIVGVSVIRYTTLSSPKTLSRYFDATHVTAKLFPSTISKINTGIQLFYVACVLASPVFGFMDHPLIQALMYTTAATTFLSGLDYMMTWRRRLQIVKNK